MKKTINEKIKELAAAYNTFGFGNDFSKEAERMSNLNMNQINEAKMLAAMSRHII